MWLFLIFVAVPMIEIGLFIQIGGIIGLWPTLAIVVMTALIGTTLMRQQGLSALRDVERSMQGQGNPAESLAHGALILVAGVLLLTPGFFTDITGLCLLVPPIRKAVIKFGAARVASKVTVFGGMAQPRPTQDARDDSIIDGEFVDLGDDEHTKGTSGWTKAQ